MCKERNHNTLQRALRQLPAYSPPVGLWSRIEGQLSGPDLPLPVRLQQLPTYSPPPQVWNHISRALETTPTPATRRRHLAIRWLGAAAAVLVLLVGTFFYYQTNHTPTVSYVYTHEPAPEPILVDWNTEEDQFADILQRVADRTDPAVEALRMELQELNAARQEMAQIMRDYGQDPDVIKQLAEIERARSAIYRQLIQSI